MKKICFVIALFSVLQLFACGGGGGGGSSSTSEQSMQPPPASSNPTYHLSTSRFTTHQPNVLEQIGAHHAYAMGLTGRGVRIGIEDTIVDYTQTSEFGNRVRLSAAEGAVLSYSRPLGDYPNSDIRQCFSPACDIWEGNSQGDEEALNDWVQQIVSEDGWPTMDDSVFILNEYWSEFNALESLSRWHEVPTPYDGGGEHGTAVASIAAGRNFGIAPEATVIPVAINLSRDPLDQQEEQLVAEVLREVVSLLPFSTRIDLDTIVASEVRNDYAKFDIINRSYGKPSTDLNLIYDLLVFDWYRRYLPQTLNAIFQTDVPDSQKTIFVYASGNDGEPWSGLGADLPYYVPELRGHSLSVAATDPSTGVIADYSNRCGPLPTDWNTARHGRHYCISAPAAGRGLTPNPNSPGAGHAADDLIGTSFAAPVVSGALALLMEHFRGTRGNTQIVKRMIDTADRTGQYANLEIYGAGHLDLVAALSPVGTLNVGQSAQVLSHTNLQTPAAFGLMSLRASGIELATFDEQDFPFWVPLSGLVFERDDNPSPIPELEQRNRDNDPASGLDALGLSWTTSQLAGTSLLERRREWMLGVGQTSAGLAYVPQAGGLRYGFSFDNSQYLGSQTHGAFGSSIQSGMVWSSRTFNYELGEYWKLTAETTLAVSLPKYENNAIFSASPSLMSAMSMHIGTQKTGLTFEQPLRAESGTGKFRIENGRIEDGRRLYNEYRIPLEPDARELQMVLRHEWETLSGNMAFETGHSINDGHVRGETESRIGLAYRMTW